MGKKLFATKKSRILSAFMGLPLLMALMSVGMVVLIRLADASTGTAALALVVGAIALGLILIGLLMLLFVLIIEAAEVFGEFIRGHKKR